MNFDEITTPSELIKANKKVELTTQQKVFNLLCEEGNIYDNVPVIKFCLENLIRVHKDTAHEAIAEDEARQAAAFAFDEAILKSIYLLLDTVDMEPPSEQ